MTTEEFETLQTGDMIRYKNHLLEICGMTFDDQEPIVKLDRGHYIEIYRISKNEAEDTEIVYKSIK